MARRGELKKNATERSKKQRKFNSRPEQKKRRAARNKIRRQANKSGRTRKGDGKDIDHRDFNPKNNKKGNTRVMPKGKNRARNQHAKKKAKK